MSLTAGSAPLSPNPAGRFDRPMPAGAVYVEPFLRRVRGVAFGRTLIDSERVLLVHRPGQPPKFAFPEADVQDLPTSPEPAAVGYVNVSSAAVPTWYEEEQELVGGHPRNPYHRIDCVRAWRQLRVEVASQVLVHTSDVICLYETSRAPVLYVSRALVRMDLLVVSPTVSYCPYKGTATYWTFQVGGMCVPDVAWSYDEPVPESAPIAGMLAFYAERTSLAQNLPVSFEMPPPASSEVTRGQ